MTDGARRPVPLLLGGAVALAVTLALALTACASGPTPAPSVPAAATRPAVATTRPAVTGALAVIPGTARQVTLSMNYGANADGRKPPAPVTVTGSVKVGEVAGLVAGQPPWPPGNYSCPFDDGMALVLAFRAHPGGPALATAILGLNGCGATDLTLGAKDYALGNPDSARSLSTKVLKVAGVPWKLPPFTWP
jgi:hypothetical protein